MTQTEDNRWGGAWRIIVLDENGQLLHKVSPDYADRALARKEITLTDHAGIVRVAPGGWHRLDGNGKPMP